MWANSTPSWWRETSTHVQVVLLALFLPGVLLHELTHAVVASPFADVDIVWGAVAVDMEWRPSTPRGAVAIAHLAPLLVGWLTGLVFVVGHVLYQPDLPGLAMIFVVVQWLLYTVPVLGDLDF